MTPQENQELGKAVERIARLSAEMQAANLEINDVADNAFDRGLIAATNKQAARKVAKQLAKESDWDEVQREAQRQLEETLDECRAALGMLADLPLGQAAEHSVTNPLHKAANGAGNGHAEPAKRSRGRPRGSRNKPKADVGDWARPPAPPVPQTEPPVPDLPDAA